MSAHILDYAAYIAYLDAIWAEEQPDLREYEEDLDLLTDESDLPF